MESYHPHHRNPAEIKEKFWKHYVFEFFMLFLAVSAGFFVENLREHFVERQREKQYIKSLTEDLKRDIAELNKYIAYNKKIMTYCDSVQHDIANEKVFSNSNHFYTHSKELARYVRFYPTERTMQQLKNAGNMRLIHEWNVSNAITAYDGKTRLMEEVDLQLREENLIYRRYLIELLDISSYDKSNPNGSFMTNNITTTGNPGFITNDPQKLKIIYNEAFTLKVLLSSSNVAAAETIQQAKELVALLYQQYTID